MGNILEYIHDLRLKKDGKTQKQAYDRRFWNKYDKAFNKGMSREMQELYASNVE